MELSMRRVMELSIRRAAVASVGTRQICRSAGTHSASQAWQYRAEIQSETSDRIVRLADQITIFPL